MWHVHEYHITAQALEQRLGISSFETYLLVRPTGALQGLVVWACAAYALVFFMEDTGAFCGPAESMRLAQFAFAWDRHIQNRLDRDEVGVSPVRGVFLLLRPSRCECYVY
jgi:hypothetical protein